MFLSYLYQLKIKLNYWKQQNQVLKEQLNDMNIDLKYKTQNQYLDLLIDPSFEGVNKLFVLSFENRRIWESHEQNFLSTVEIKEYSVMIDGWIFFDQPIKNDLRTYDNIWKITISQGDDYTTGCLLDYPYFKEYYKLIAINLSKRQKLDADSKAIQQINFTENLRWAGNT